MKKLSGRTRVYNPFLPPPNRFQASRQGLRLNNHSRSAAVGRIVASTVSVGCKITKIDDLHFDYAPFDRFCHYRTIEVLFNYLRKQGEYCVLHNRTQSSFNSIVLVCTSIVPINCSVNGTIFVPPSTFISSKSVAPFSIIDFTTPTSSPL